MKEVFVFIWPCERISKQRTWNSEKLLSFEKTSIQYIYNFYPQQNFNIWELTTQIRWNYYYKYSKQYVVCYKLFYLLWSFVSLVWKFFMNGISIQKNRHRKLFLENKRSQWNRKRPKGSELKAIFTTFSTIFNDGTIVNKEFKRG